MLILWVWLSIQGLVMHPGHLVDVDFAVYQSAARVVSAGGNPYNHAVLLREERRLLSRVGNYAIRQPALTRVGEPPILFWVLEPLAWLPFRLGAWIMNLALLLLAAVGSLAAARALALSGKSSIRATIVVLMMPQTVIYILNGNIGLLVFAALGVGVWLSRRFPAAAGAVLSLSVVKPQVALPLAGCVLLFNSCSTRKSLAGFVLGSACIVGASAATVGVKSLEWWLAGLRDFSTTIPTQGAMPSLAGIYVELAPSLQVALSALCLAGAALITAIVYCRLPRTPRPIPIVSLGWLWAVWFLAVPYCHLMDEIFLAPVLLAMLGHSDRRLQRAGLVILYGALFSVLPVSVADVSLIPAVPLAALAALIVYGRISGIEPSRTRTRREVKGPRVLQRRGTA